VIVAAAAVLAPGVALVVPVVRAAVRMQPVVVQTVPAVVGVGCVMVHAPVVERVVTVSAAVVAMLVTGAVPVPVVPVARVPAVMPEDGRVLGAVRLRQEFMRGRCGIAHRAGGRHLDRGRRDVRDGGVHVGAVRGRRTL
jgi:hypothetical protein